MCAKREEERGKRDEERGRNIASWGRRAKEAPSHHPCSPTAKPQPPPARYLRLVARVVSRRDEACVIRGNESRVCGDLVEQSTYGFSGLIFLG